jgi:gliding motility-associated lipoprotein GldH
LKVKLKNSLGLVGFVCASLLFGSCRSEDGFTVYKTTAEEGLSTTPVTFELPEQAIDTLTKNVFIRLRNDNTYPYANIFLIARLTAGGERITQDTLEYAMAAPDGKWLGTGFTEIKESKLWWKEGVVFPKARPLTISIAQAVRNNGVAEGVSKLKGIIAVGISIEDQ